MKTGKRILSMLICTILLLSSLGGCAKQEESSKQTDVKTETNSQKNAQTKESSPEEVVTLNILTTKISSNLNDYPDSPIMEALADKIGVKVNIIEADADKYNVYMASGEGFDLILSPTTNFSQLIQGNVVIPMDSLLEEYGKDITSNIPDTVKFSKSNWSDGTNELYFLPCQIGVDSQGIAQGMGTLTRWDYYKELGYPEINSLDEWLAMLAQMQQSHPSTEEGLPVYGVSMFADWGVWSYKYPLACTMAIMS